MVSKASRIGCRFSASAVSALRVALSIASYSTVASNWNYYYYYSWWEMHPSNAIQVVSGSVSPGDSISASVAKSGSSYTLR